MGLSHWALPTVSFDVNAPTRKKEKKLWRHSLLISRLQQRSLICIRELIMIFSSAIIFLLFWPRLVEDEEAGNSNRTWSLSLFFSDSLLCECMCVYCLASIYARSTRRATTIMSVGNDRWIRLVLMTSAVLFHFFGRLLHPPRHEYRWGRAVFRGGCVRLFSCRASFNTNSLCISININVTCTVYDVAYFLLFWGGALFGFFRFV